jgi:hypothetical protein
MADPSWRQLCAIHESVTKRAILHALSIEPPPQAISNRCELSDGLVLWAGESGLIEEYKTGTCFTTAKEVLKQHRLSKGTPSGDLARWWLTAKGYLP